MRHIATKRFAIVSLLSLSLPFASGSLGAQAKAARYPAMAPLDQYMMAEGAEIALAKTAAPASLSGDAEVMVLRRDGYATAVQGRNGFVCIVERSWGKATDDPEFWNPKMRAPHCFNPQAVRTFLPIYLMKSRLVLAGKSNAEILKAVNSAMDSRQIPPLEPGAMAYMMSKQQYLSDRDMGWYPHVMFFIPGDTTKSWAAELPDSPVMAGADPEERTTILFVLADKWSDGTAAPPNGPLIP